MSTTKTVEMLHDIIKKLISSSSDDRKLFVDLITQKNTLIEQKDKQIESLIAERATLQANLDEMSENVFSEEEGEEEEGSEVEDPTDIPSHYGVTPVSVPQAKEFIKQQFPAHTSAAHVALELNTKLTSIKQFVSLSKKEDALNHPSSVYVLQSLERILEEPNVNDATV